MTTKKMGEAEDPHSLFDTECLRPLRTDIEIGPVERFDLRAIFRNDRRDSEKLLPCATARRGERPRFPGGSLIADISNLEVLAPHIARRQSGVTATLERVVPAQAESISIAVVGCNLPASIPRVRALDLFKLRRLPPSGRPRVWHARRNIEMLAGIVLKDVFRFPIRLVFTSASQRRHTRWTRSLIDRMDALIATSRATADYLEHPAVVIPHGIDANVFSPYANKSAVRQSLGLPNLKLVGCFGRIRARKGTDVFVDALLPILASRPDVAAVLLGCTTSQHQAFMEKLRSKIRVAQVEDRFFVLPEVTTSEMPDWYRALDVYVAPQRWEGFGVTPLEAMASGVPVVATEVGAFPGILTSETGLLVEPGNPDAMTKAILTMLDDPQRLQAMGEAGRLRVLQSFSIDEEARRINEVYSKIWAEANVGWPRGPAGDA